MLVLFGGALAVLCLYVGLLGWGWRRARQQAIPASDDRPPISVVVPARNEEDSLPALLEALDQQTHPNHEVVIVDDASTDDTVALAEEWTSNRTHARVVSVTDPTSPRKKHALSRGIDAARHDLLAFTDADCAPPPDWLSVLAGTHAASDGDRVLVGYSPLRGPGLLGRFVQYETLLHALYATAAIGLHRPYMAVGRNLSYPRSVFEAVGGFDHSGGGRESMSGDDDLFVQAVHRQDAAEVRALLDDRTFVPSTAPTSWTAWARQRRRHVSAGRHYPWTVGTHLTLFHASLLLLWIAPLGLGPTGVGLLATGLLARHTVLGPAAETFSATDTLAVFPLWELGYALSRFVLGPVGLLRPPETW